MPDSDDPDAKPVMSMSFDVFADGSTRERLSCVDDTFWDVRKAMVALRDRLDADIRNGPQLCPFSPRNKDRST